MTKDGKVEREFLRIDELVDYFGISRAMAFQLSHKQGFPICKVGRLRLIPKAALQDWIKENTVFSGK